MRIPNGSCICDDWFFIKDLCVSETVSFWWPQVVPARAFIILRRLDDLVVMFLIRGRRRRGGRK